MKTEDRFGELRALIEVARRLSFVDAARALSMPASSLSRKISALEARLGARLFQRTTRRVALTEIGQHYLARCERILADLGEADAAVSTFSNSPRGLLRIDVPMTFGRLHISPALPEFLHRYPDVRIDMMMSDQFVNLIEESIDVAIRIGELDDSRLVARKLAPNRRVLCGSPAYFASHGVPRSPHDLIEHSCLNFSYLLAGDVWRLSNKTGEAAVPVSGRLRANNAEALFEAALGGCGIALLATFIAGPSLRDGSLITVLDDWALRRTNIYAVYPSGRYLTPKAKAFVDFFARRFADTPYWDDKSR